MPRKKAAKAETGESPSASEKSKTKNASGRGKRKSSDNPEPEAKKPKTLMNKTDTEFHTMDFSHEAATSEGNAWNLKISTWNCDGIRAWVKKGGHKYVLHENPDIFCLQETKCSEDKLPEEARKIDGYTSYWCAGETDGYAGVGLYSKVKPLSVKCGIGDQEFDKEGRVLTAEYDKFYLVNVYVPNAGRGLVNLDRRMQWDVEFRKYLKNLDSKKGVVLCGDLNVAHHEIDIANPKGNKKNAGFTQEERDGFTQLLKEGFVDSFRYKHPETKAAYTFWTYMANARAKNIGWRLDYFVLSKKLLPNLCDCVIRCDVLGSDHCPVVLLMHV